MGLRVPTSLQEGQQKRVEAAVDSDGGNLGRLLHIAAEQWGKVRHLRKMER